MTLQDFDLQKTKIQVIPQR